MNSLQPHTTAQGCSAAAAAVQGAAAGNGKRRVGNRGQSVSSLDLPSGRKPDRNSAVHGRGRWSKQFCSLWLARGREAVASTKPATPAERTGVSKAEAQEAAFGASVDAWADSVATDAGGWLACREPRGDAETLTALQHQAGARDEMVCALREFLCCLQRVRRSAAEELQVLSSGIVKHSVGVTSATSFAELQHHLTELVQLSGPEVSKSCSNP